MDDTKIIDLYWTRSESAITETAQKYGRYCRSIAFRILRNDQDSEECVNDTWLRAWNAIPPRRPPVLSAFLGRITRNLALDRWKYADAEKRGSGELTIALEDLRECVPSPGGVESALDEMALTDALNRFVGTLPEEQGDIFLQRYWYLCSVREIAEMHGASVNRVNVSLSRIRKKLRNYLQKEGISL